MPLRKNGELMGNKRISEYLQLAAVLFIVLCVYLYTMHPVFKNNDSPETSAAAATLGIGHPPGYPLYALAGKIFTMIPLANTAFRVNLLSAFLSLLVLIVTYFTIKRINFVLFGKSYMVVGYMAIWILAFSYIFWNQAIEAKGGIYILNLLFLSLLVYLSVLLFERFNVRYFYLAAFIYGLSLTNHWPSMIILFPVFGYFGVKYFRNLSKFRVIIITLLFFLGLSVYLYLPVRSLSSPVLEWGDPSTFSGFLWILLRKAYVYPVEPSFYMYKYQVLEFLKLIATNYSFLVILAVAGAFAMYKKEKKLLYFLGSVFTIVVVMVVFYNRTKEDVLWLMHIFLMPALYVLAPLMAAGVLYITRLIRPKIYLGLFTAAMLGGFILMSAGSFEKNNHSRDFLSYDYGYDLAATMNKNDIYIGEGDYNLMPLYYIREIQKRRQDIGFITVSFIIFDWGICEAVSRIGEIDMVPFEASKNVEKIINRFAPERGVYRSNYFTRAEEIKTGYSETQKGLLIKYGDEKEACPPEIFELYSYRNVFRNFVMAHKTNSDLVGWYPVSMVNQANRLLSLNRSRDAIMLYKKSLLFPTDKPEANIYYNISLAYRNLKNEKKEMENLKIAVGKNTEIIDAYERMGMIYYSKTMFPLAIKCFNKAIEKGSENEKIKKTLKILGDFKETDMLEASLIKANEYITKPDYDKAMEIYDYLLEKSYKSAIIYRNIGVYHFKTNNYSKAIGYFKRSKNETPHGETSLYLAYTYLKAGMIKEAKAEAEEGYKSFPANKQLADFYNKIKGLEDDKKNTDSGNGQR